MKLTPLTKEQQALCVRWRKYAYKCATRHYAHHPHLRDIIESRVNLVLCSAARTWDPRKGEFKHWVARWVNGIGQTVRRERGPVHESLDAPLPNMDGLDVMDTIAAPEDETGLDAVDMEGLKQRLLAELPPRLLRNNPKTQPNIARLDVADWLRWTGGATATDLGAQRGVSRQRMDQVLKRVQGVFERWAREIRQEAA